MTTWYVRKSGAVTNGGDSPTITKTGNDGSVSVGTNTLTAASGAFNNSLIGRYIYINGIAAGSAASVRRISSVTDSTHLVFSGAATVVTNSSQLWTIGGAWGTFSTAIGTTGWLLPTNGDTVYVASGVYRETVTVGLTATATCNVIGDKDGSHTGDPAGPIRLSSWTAGDLAPPTAVSALHLNGKPFVSFSNIVFEGGNTAAGCVNASAGSHDFSFTDCAFLAPRNLSIGFLHASQAGIASNMLIDRCLFVCFDPGNAGNGFLTITVARSTVDYSLASTIRNCMFLGASGQAIRFSSSGAGAGFGGGTAITNCTMLFCASAGVATGDANLSTTFPVTVSNSIIATAGTCLIANTLGQIVEDYNVFSGNLRTNVATGAHSMAETNTAFLLHVGQERTWDGLTRPFGTPIDGSPLLGFGDDGTAPSVDMLNRPRPAGVGCLADSGTFTSGSSLTATNTSAVWGTNIFNGATIKITGGTGSGQVKLIKSHTSTVITVYGNWSTTPDNTSTYAIYFGNPAESFTCTSGTTTTAVQASASWAANMWVGYSFAVTAGTGNGQSGTVVSNTTTTLTFSALVTGLDSTSKLTLCRKTDENAVNKTVGALERHDTAVKETTLTDAGSVAWKITGRGDQEVVIPVDTTSTTITVKCSFDTDHGNATKPQIELVADAEFGVSGQTVTATGSAGSGTFELLSLTPFTATTAGYVTVRFKSRSAKPTGRAVFDTLSVT